ncbi:MAG: transglycosylase SLT domain-containing protein [Arenicella sp.]|nr:transglycosylase SLT domain-containing protein [Arenicella sp.]
MTILPQSSYSNLSARLVLTLSLLLANAIPAQASDIDPDLIQALKQATHDIQERRTDLDALTWLSNMSEKLERRIPDPYYRIRLLKAVASEAERAGLDPQLVLAVIDIESNFNRHALSHAGAQGLMQVMPFWKEVYGNVEDDLYNPLVSLRYGCTILRHYMDKYPNPTRALAAYNGSLGRDVYPNKIFKRKASSWQYKEDRYSRSFDQRSTVIARGSISDQLSLN